MTCPKPECAALRARLESAIRQAEADAASARRGPTVGDIYRDAPARDDRAAMVRRIEDGTHE